MTKEKFTEAPWEASDTDEFGDINITRKGGVLAIAAVVNGEFKRMGGEFDEHLANAHLIAAAPCMYKKLESLISILTEAARAYRHLQKDNKSTEALDFRKEIEELLAKARGEKK